jgi:hypothetical protein
MLSIYSGVSQIYTPSRWVNFYISVGLYIERLRQCMQCYDGSNVVTVTKTNMINEMPCCCGTVRHHDVKKCHQTSYWACAEIPAALQISRWHVPRSLQLQHLAMLIVNLVSSWMDLHNCSFFLDYLLMPLQSMGAHCNAPGGPWNIWKFEELLVRCTGVSGRFDCDFWSVLHFPDAISLECPLPACLTECYLVSFQDTLMHTPEHALNFTSNWPL